MQNLTPTTVAYVGVFVGAIGAFVGFVGAVVGIVNSRMAVRWKRTELASTYMKDFNNNPELVFAGRCLDWNKGRLALPESLRCTCQMRQRLFNMTGRYLHKRWIRS